MTKFEYSSCYNKTEYYSLLDKEIEKIYKLMEPNGSIRSLINYILYNNR